jgi:hypothetical protein
MSDERQGRIVKEEERHKVLVVHKDCKPCSGEQYSGIGAQTGFGLGPRNVVEKRVNLLSTLIFLML